MSHNPPRPPGLSPQAAARLHDEFARRRSPRQWYDIAELAELLVAKSRLGKTVPLTPHTAAFIGSHLRKVAAKPTRDDIARMICNRGEANRCDDPCFTCRGRANMVVAAYGHSIEPLTRDPTPPSPSHTGCDAEPEERAACRPANR